MHPIITTEQRSQLQENGYFILENLFRDHTNAGHAQVCQSGIVRYATAVILYDCR